MTEGHEGGGPQAGGDGRRVEHKIVYVEGARSHLLDGDSDIEDHLRSDGHILPQLLREGWSVRGVSAANAGAVAYVVLERTVREPPHHRPAFRLPAGLLDEVLDAIADLEDSPLRLTLSQFEENAVRAELRKLREEHNDGEPFPRRPSGHRFPAPPPGSQAAASASREGGVPDAEVHRRVKIPAPLFEEVLDAVAFLSGPPHHLTVAGLEIEALRKELEHLRFVHNSAKPFPPRDRRGRVTPG
jgi:hypothetical protein